MLQNPAQVVGRSGFWKDNALDLVAVDISIALVLGDTPKRKAGEKVWVEGVREGDHQVETHRVHWVHLLWISDIEETALHISG